MNFKYLPYDKERGKPPRFFLSPSNHEEQKALTIIRDALRTGDVVLRLHGSKDDNKNKKDMPANPVMELSLSIENSDGTISEIFIPKKVDKLDPNREIPTTDHAIPTSVSYSKNSGIRIVKQKERDGGSSTIIEKE